VLERFREGPNVYFRLAATGPGAGLARFLMDALPEAERGETEQTLAADRRRATALRAERARAALADSKALQGGWDEMAALGLPARAVEEHLLAQLPATAQGRLLDIGTGAGRLLEALGPRMVRAIGVDISRSMLAIARARLAEKGLANCSVRQADMYNLPFPEAAFDLVTVQMVLHYAEDPPAVLAEAARVLAPGGRLVVIDLAPHLRGDLTRNLAHRWAGFEDAEMARWFAAIGLATPATPLRLPAPAQGLAVMVWGARRPGAGAEAGASEASANTDRAAMAF